ncbi:MAG: hypothetical protein H8D35_08040 [Nitrosopumilus sp.]|nr:hypothetical protein [Nitrosopumilus sp.]
MYPAHSQTIQVEKPISSYQNYIDQATQSPHWKQAQFDGFNLPAQGQSKPYCKKWISYGCDNIKQHPRHQHYAEHTLKTCKVSNCPLCFESWIGRQANRSTKRLAKFLEKRRFNFRHVVLSPPPDQAVNLTYASLKKWLQTALKVANIQTAMIVFHPFRFQDKKKSMPYDSPHFHLLVYGHVTNTTEFYNKTKWNIKNLGDLETDKDIFTCTRYLLSHAGVKKGTHTVRYLGDISYRKLKVEKEGKIPHCPYCSLPLRIFSINFDSKHEPPPIDHVGLWDPSCFSPVDDNGNDTKIPFYQMDNDNQKYSEELIYSFEELMHIQLNSHKICEHKYFYNQLKFKSALSCKTITSFC